MLRLAEEGKLALADPLVKFFAEFAAHKDVTIRHLLTHTSGLHSYTDKPEFLSRVGEPIEPAQLIAWFKDDKPDFAPGAGFTYCNSGYFLLGEIVAKVSRKPLRDYLREAFFQPLGMDGLFTVTNLPSYRLLIDMSDLDRARIVITTGQSGHPFDRHYTDQIEPWRTGSTLPLPFTPAAINAATVTTLALQPPH